MIQMKLYYASIFEYIMIWGTPIGSEGHSGRHAVGFWDTVIDGEMWYYGEGQFDKRVYRPGDRVYVGPNQARAMNFTTGVWAVEYARGPLPLSIPFGLADELVSTLDFATAAQTLSVSTRRWSGTIGASRTPTAPSRPPCAGRWVRSWPRWAGRSPGWFVRRSRTTRSRRIHRPGLPRHQRDRRCTRQQTWATAEAAKRFRQPGMTTGRAAERAPAPPAPRARGASAPAPAGRAGPGCAQVRGRADQAGTAGEHVDAAGPPLGPEPLGQHPQVGLRGRVVGDQRRALAAGHRAEQDHAAASAGHHGRRRSRASGGRPPGS